TLELLRAADPSEGAIGNGCASGQPWLTPRNHKMPTGEAGPMPQGDLRARRGSPGHPGRPTSGDQRNAIHPKPIVIVLSCQSIGSEAATAALAPSRVIPASIERAWAAYALKRASAGERRETVFSPVAFVACMRKLPTILNIMMRYYSIWKTAAA